MSGMIDDLFTPLRATEELGPGAVFFPAAALEYQAGILDDLRAIVSLAPLRRLMTPGGRRFSVEMTNCGALGWHSDTSGYRYETRDPLSNCLWPEMPARWVRLASGMAARAGFSGFVPQTCLVNCYRPGARMGLHQDRDETALDNPIVSVSIGVEAQFLFGGLARSDAPRKLTLLSGDVVVWGGRSRLAYHGVAPLRPGHHALTGEVRWNLTFRRVHAASP